MPLILPLMMMRPVHHILPLLTFALLGTTAHPSAAQARIGISISPSISHSRAHIENDSISLKGTGAALRPIAALRIDLPMGNQYFFSTGLQYFSRPLSLTKKVQSGPYTDERYRIQHLQIPIMIKMLTSEFAIDKRIYAQLGPTIDINIHDQIPAETAVVVTDFKLLGLTLNMGAGVEFRLGVHTYLQAGLSYTRGLTNLVQASEVSPRPVLKNDGVNMDLVLMF